MDSIIVDIKKTKIVFRSRGLELSFLSLSDILISSVTLDTPPKKNIQASNKNIFFAGISLIKAEIL